MTRWAAALAGCAICASLVEAQPRPEIVPPGVQERRLVYRVPPEYPEPAKKAQIQGTVKLAAPVVTQIEVTFAPRAWQTPPSVRVLRRGGAWPATPARPG